MSRFVDLLLLLARLAQRISEKIKAARAQGEMDALQAEPSEWYADHFSGGVQSGGEGETCKADADGTPKG